MNNKIPRKTLKRIEEDIENNNLGKARDRLHASSLHTQMNYIFENNSEIFIINYNIQKWLDVTGI